jgi:hypothetical protein
VPSGSVKLLAGIKVAFAMVWYVALIAILNIGLGYALGTYLRTGRGNHDFRPIASEPTSYDEYDDAYESDDSDTSYGQGIEEEEYDTAEVG